MTIDTSDDHQVTRSRVDRATASYYPGSRRVVMVADAGDFAAAAGALIELARHIMGDDDAAFQAVLDNYGGV